mgnify:CR=1 FL=1
MINRSLYQFVFNRIPRRRGGGDAGVGLYVEEPTTKPTQVAE